MTDILLKLWKNIPLSKDAQISIMRLFQDKFLVGVTGLIFNEKDEVLLFRHTYRDISWGLPSGFLKSNEHPVTGLEREIEEESGFVVSIEERIEIRLDKEFSFFDICYMGLYIGGDFKSSNEVIDFGFFSMDSLPLLSKTQYKLIDYGWKYRNRNKLKTVENIQNHYNTSKISSPAF